MQKKGWPGMAHDFDLLVVGGGSGGVATARRAAEYGAKVAICEDHQWGGTCVHRGCVPKKLLVYASHLGSARRLMPAYGWGDPAMSLDWPTLRSHLTAELERLQGFYRRILEESGVALLSGKGVLTGPHTVQVEQQEFSAQRILLATGGRPLPPPGLQGAQLAWTSDDMFWLPDWPRSVLVVGSGYIGTEFAGLLCGLGVEVHQSFGSERPLPGFDGDLRATVEREMEKRGVRFHRRARPVAIESTANGQRRVIFDQGDDCLVDGVLLATGRQPRTAEMGLEEVGVALGPEGQVLVDRGFQTSVPSIYAIGDCLKRFELTPVAIAEGRALAEHLYNGRSLNFAYDCLPTAVFSSPPAASVGYTEEALRALGVRFDIYRARFRPMKFSLAKTDDQALIKILVDPASDRVVGCHLVAEEAPELIQVLAVTLKGRLTKTVFDSTLAVHPTLAEELVLLRKPSESVEGPNAVPPFEGDETPAESDRDDQS